MITGAIAARIRDSCTAVLRSGEIIIPLLFVFVCVILRLIFLWRNNRIGDMFKKAVEMFPSCAPLLRAFASYCDNGTRPPLKRMFHSSTLTHSSPSLYCDQLVLPSTRRPRPSARVSHACRRAPFRMTLNTTHLGKLYTQCSSRGLITDAVYLSALGAFSVGSDVPGKHAADARPA